jgi:site-specific DNA-methyltransferase (adenine-specific)
MTYLVVGPVQSKAQAENLKTYLETRFARFLISLRKISQNTTTSTYSWVPELDWNKRWDDEALFELFGLSSKEIEYVQSVVKEI